MLTIVIYLLLSIFDALAVMILALKMYRLPLWDYKNRILLMAVFISLVSYILRVVLHVPEIDLPIQIIMFILFFRYGMQIKLFYSALIVSASLNAYIVIQLGILYAFVLSNTMSYNVVFQTSDAQIQLIQIITILSVYLLATGLKVFNFGFSFIISPPHDFNFKEIYSGTNRALLLSIVGAVVVISLALVVILSYMAYVIIISAATVYSLSYYLSYKKETNNDRKISIIYGAKNKIP